MLHRTFSEISHLERQKMMTLVKAGRLQNEKEKKGKGENMLDLKKAKDVIATVQLLLGIE